MAKRKAKLPRTHKQFESLMNASRQGGFSEGLAAARMQGEAQREAIPDNHKLRADAVAAMVQLSKMAYCLALVINGGSQWGK